METATKLPRTDDDIARENVRRFLNVTEKIEAQIDPDVRLRVLCRAHKLGYAGVEYTAERIAGDILYFQFSECDGPHPDETRNRVEAGEATAAEVEQLAEEVYAASQADPNPVIDDSPVEF